MIPGSPSLKCGGLLFFGLLLFLAILHSFCLWRSSFHYGQGRAFLQDDRILEAAREFQSAIGFYAPFNPYSRTAAARLAYLSYALPTDQESLAAELKDRLNRSLFSIRSLYQPYSDLLDGDLPDTGPPRDVPRDPHPVLFLLSLLCVTIGMGVWWTPSLVLPAKGVVSVVAMAGWATFLYLC